MVSFISDSISQIRDISGLDWHVCGFRGTAGTPFSSIAVPRHLGKLEHRQYVVPLDEVRFR